MGIVDWVIIIFLAVWAAWALRSMSKGGCKGCCAGCNNDSCKTRKQA